MFLKTGPSRAIPPGVNMPHCLAIAEAVWILSPDKEYTREGAKREMNSSVRDRYCDMRKTFK